MPTPKGHVTDVQEQLEETRDFPKNDEEDVIDQQFVRFENQAAQATT
jgi:hypothetical protein